jgi:hypothetical protein
MLESGVSGVRDARRWPVNIALSCAAKLARALVRAHLVGDSGIAWLRLTPLRGWRPSVRLIVINPA